MSGTRSGRPVPCTCLCYCYLTQHPNLVYDVLESGVDPVVYYYGPWTTMNSSTPVLNEWVSVMNNIGVEI
jgi:hypothetical protein